MNSTANIFPFGTDAMALSRGERKRVSWLQKTPRPCSRSSSAILKEELRRGRDVLEDAGEMLRQELQCDQNPDTEHVVDGRCRMRDVENIRQILIHALEGERGGERPLEDTI